MQLSKYETDLQILIDNKDELEKVKSIIKKYNFSYTWLQSDVKCQSWEGKMFLNIPFGIELIDILEINFNITSNRV